MEGRRIRRELDRTTQRGRHRHPACRLAIAAAISATVLAAGAAPAAASITLGQLAPGSPPQGFSDPSGMWDIAQPTVTSGNSYVVPEDGTITSWSHNAAAPAGQMLTFKVFRPVTGLTYTVVGHDGPRTLTGGALNTFPTSILVKPGDVIGLFFSLAAPAKAATFLVPGEPFLFRDGNLADGESGAFKDSPGRRVNATAVFVPSNAFALGDLRRNTRKGTATLTVTGVPNPGELVLAGKGVKTARAGGAVIAKTVTAPGDVKLKIRATGKKKRRLNATGKVKLNLAVTYTPTGGDPSTQTLRVKLKKKL